MPLSREQSQIWDAMGIGPQWILRSAEDPLLPKKPSAQPARAPAPAARVQVPRQSPSVHPVPAARVSAPRQPEARSPAPAAIPGRVMPRSPAAAAQSSRFGDAAAAPIEIRVDPGIAAAVASAGWDELKGLADRCHACQMAGSRTNTVLAAGKPGCPIVIVGEAPGRDEDLQGYPFVGKSGQLLDNILAAVSLQRGRDVAIINVLKCRPPFNRDPRPEEAQACRAFLMRQLELLEPKVLILMGRHAVNALLAESNIRSIEALREKHHECTLFGKTVPTVVTYHPSYLLRNPVAKEKSWHDLLLAKSLLAGGA